MLSETVPGNGALLPYGKRFPNMFHNVTFPTPTYYCPPQPPSQLMGRYHPPPRPGPRYKNDLSLAGPREHEAQTEVARMWRGIMTRRQLRNARTFHHVRVRRATMIQCWWRRLRAIWCLRKLKKIVEEWAVERREQYVLDRLNGYGVMMTWQRKRFERAVVLLQRMYRWYVNQRQRMHASANGSGIPEALPFPLPHKKKLYFPWRRMGLRPVVNGVSSVLRKAPEPKNGKVAAIKRPRLSLHTSRNALLQKPPLQEELEEINARMREGEAKLAETLAQPEVLDRQKWKRDGLREFDFDHNAGMIQRMVRYKWAGLNKMTLGVTAKYFYKKVFIIQRAFLISKTLRGIEYNRRCVANRSAKKNQAYAQKKLEELMEEMAWQSQLLNCAALTIQKAYAYYKSRKVFRDPFAHLVSKEEQKVEESDPSKTPPPPPYHYIDKHIARERALREAAQSKAAREMQEAQKSLRRTKSTFVPERIIVVSFDAPESESVGVSSQKSLKQSKRSLPFTNASECSSKDKKESAAPGDHKRKRNAVLLPPDDRNGSTKSNSRVSS